MLDVKKSLVPLESYKFTCQVEGGAPNHKNMKAFLFPPKKGEENIKSLKNPIAQLLPSNYWDLLE